MLTAQEIIKKTLDLAKKSDDSDVPVAAIVICDSQIIASATNTRERDQDLFGHAEMNAIKIAQKKLKTWNLSNCQIYISLEPCVMCAGAIAQAHIAEIYFAAYDYKFGACGSKYMVFPKNTKIQGGICELEAQEILKDFFAKKR